MAYGLIDLNSSWMFLHHSDGSPMAGCNKPGIPYVPILSMSSSMILDMGIKSGSLTVGFRVLGDKSLINVIVYPPVSSNMACWKIH